MLSVSPTRLLDVLPGRPGERPFVASASGLARVGSRLYVVADDEQALAIFPGNSSAPGRRVALLDPDAAVHASLPKADKPDLEALCAIGDDRLLAIPSGSSPARRTGALISLNLGEPERPTRLLDFGPLLALLATRTPDLNLEGAAVFGDSLWLAQRGNRATPSALFELGLREALTADAVPARAFRRELPLKLGHFEGIPFAPTDLCALPDGRLLVSAVCEDTADSYHDGACVAAAVALLNPDGSVERLVRLDPTWKIEGLVAEVSNGGLTLSMVCDADDPSRPSPLLQGEWR